MDICQSSAHFKFIPFIHSHTHTHRHTHACILTPFEDHKPVGLKVDTNFPFNMYVTLWCPRPQAGVQTLKVHCRKVVVVGAGYIAVELAGIFNALGSHTSILIRYDEVMFLAAFIQFSCLNLLAQNDLYRYLLALTWGFCCSLLAVPAWFLLSHLI